MVGSLSPLNLTILQKDFIEDILVDVEVKDQSCLELANEMVVLYGSSEELMHFDP